MTFLKKPVLYNSLIVSSIVSELKEPPSEIEIIALIVSLSTLSLPIILISLMISSAFNELNENNKSETTNKKVISPKHTSVKKDKYQKY